MRKHLAPFALLAGAAVLLSGCGESPNARGDTEDNTNPSELVFAVVPTDNSEDLLKSYEPVVAAIEEVTDIPVTLQAVSNNAGVIEAQVAERVDIAVYGAFSYYLAEDVAEIEVVAMDQLSPEPGSGAVNSIGVTESGSDITSLEDLTGKDVCFTDPASTTGYLAAASAMMDAGIDPEEDLNPVFAGAHDTAVTQMLAGDCEAAFVAETFVTDILPARDIISEGDTETFFTSDPLPGPPLVVGNWLSDDLKAQITQAMADYDAVSAVEAGFCDEENQRKAPAPWGEEYVGTMACDWGGTGGFAMESATDSDYDTIRDICETTQAEVCRDDA